MNAPAKRRRPAQLSFSNICPIDAAVEAMSTAGIDERGAVFTRREVVDFILDLVGYSVDRPLHHMRLLEPSAGDGDFLLPAIDRLLASWQKAGKPTAVETLRDAVRAVELNRVSVDACRRKVISRLIEEGLPRQAAESLAASWVMQGDFLLTHFDQTFDFVIGNPPYVRQELIPDALIMAYRARYRTIYDRADLYIPFIERALELLSKSGACGLICSDRWMKNRYGGPLRAFVADNYHLKIYVDMVGTTAFHADVVAYPAITVITADRPGGPTRIAHRPPIAIEPLAKLAKALTSDAVSKSQGEVRELYGVAAGSEPWLLEESAQLALVRRLEASFPTLEEVGCKVGIGVATGADKAFIGPFKNLDVEPDRKLPLVMTRDIQNGNVSWRGLGVINPFGDDGRLVDLADYPRLRTHLEAHRNQIVKRHVAQKSPRQWYRTIDRIYPAIAKKPKLLIPDIKGEAHVVYERGELYPHHNLYFITSDHWNVRALQAVLLSGIARLFVATYSTRMRGGYLRFQAQYLRRIRLPAWDSVQAVLQNKLIEAATDGDVVACNQAVFDLYGLSKSERMVLGGGED